MTEPPPNRYAKNGDLHIAYQVAGEGTVHSGGETGTIDCGAPSGSTLATQGPDSCASGGKTSYTLDGSSIKDTFTFLYGQITPGSRPRTHRGRAPLGPLHLHDYVTAPITRGTVRLEGVLRG